MSPAVVSGIVIGDATVSYLPIFSLSIATVLKVFAKVISLKWQIVIQGCYPLSDPFFLILVTLALPKFEKR